MAEHVYLCRFDSSTQSHFTTLSIGIRNWYVCESLTYVNESLHETNIVEKKTFENSNAKFIKRNGGHFEIEALKCVESPINFPLKNQHRNYLNINLSSSFIAYLCFKEKCCQNRNRNKAWFRWVRKQFLTLWKNSEQNRMQYKQIEWTPQNFIQQYKRIISHERYRDQSPIKIMHQSYGSVFTLICTFAVIYRVSISYLFPMKNSRHHSSTQVVVV